MTERTFYSHSLSEATKDAREFIDKLEADQFMGVHAGRGHRTTREFIDKLEADQFMGVHAGRGHRTKGDVRYVIVKFSGDDPLNVNATEIKEVDMKDQSHDDLLKRYVNLSQENLRLKRDLTKITRDRDDLSDFCKGVAININKMLTPKGDA